MEGVIGCRDGHFLDGLFVISFEHSESEVDSMHVVSW